MTVISIIWSQDPLIPNSDLRRFVLFHRNVNRAIKRWSWKRAESLAKRFLKWCFMFLFPEKRRPRTFGPDSDSLAPWSSGESDSFLLYSIHIPRACIERKLITHTYTYTYTHNYIYITRINSRITPRVMRIVTHIQAHVHIFCQLLSLRRWCMEPSTFSPLSLSFFSLVVLWLISCSP